MDFSEAAQTFVDLQEQRRRGILTESQFRIAVDQLRVQDNSGTWWQPNPDSGGWLFWNETSWLPGVPHYQAPPHPQPAPPSPPPPPALKQQKPVSPAPTSPPPPPPVIKLKEQPAPPLPPLQVVPIVPAPAPKAKAKPPINMNKVVAGVIVLAIVFAGVFIVLPMMSGSNKPLGGPGIPAHSTTRPFASQTALTTPYPISATVTRSVSLEPGPTQNPPDKLMVYFSVQKDAVTDDVTVTLSGGPGLGIVKNIEFQLTRSDGQVLTKDFAPDQKLNEATMQGTPGADRVEVTVTYFSGEHYKMVDQLVQMRQRM